MKGLKEKIFEVSTIGLTDIIGTGIAAIFWLYIASELGPESYGEITFLISIASIISGISLFGSNDTILVLVSKKKDIQVPIYLISLTASIIGSIVIFVLFANLGISLLIIGYVLFSLVTFDLLARKFYKNYSKYVILQKILLVIFGVGAYYLIGENGVLIGIALSHAHFIFHILKTFKNFKIDFNLIKEKKRFILNNFMISISGIFSGSLDKLIIAPLLGFLVLGNYSLGIQFFSILCILPSVCEKYLVTQDISKISNKTLKGVMIIVSVIFAILGTIIGPIIVSHIFPEFVDAEIVIQIISWAIIPITIQSTYFLPKFWAHEKNKIILVTTLTTLLVQIIGILVLGSMYGIIGLSIALVTSSIFGVIVSCIADKFFLKLNKNEK